MRTGSWGDITSFRMPSHAFQWNAICVIRWFLPCPLARIIVSRVQVSEKLDEATVRRGIIWRLPGLQFLGGCAVREKERLDAEREYLKIIPSDHPRYQALAEKYGAPVAAADRSLKVESADVSIRYNKTTISKKLPLNMRISTLVMALSRQFRIPPSRGITLTYAEGGVAEEMTDTTRELGHYGVRTGGTIVVA